MRKPLLNILVPLILGCLIYLIFRQTDIGVFRWINRLSHGFLEHFRIHESADTGFLYLLKYNLPDGLWFYSLISFLLSIWIRKDKPYPFYIWMTIYVVAAVLFEVGQLTPYIRGTFDPADLMAYLLAAILILLFHFRKFNFNLNIL